MGAEAKADQEELEDVDLMDVSWFAEGPPHVLFERMRAGAPVRWKRTSVVNYFARTATRDTEVAGEEIAEGDSVRCFSLC